MRKLLIIIALSVTAVTAHSQAAKRIDSLRQLLQTEIKDTSRVYALRGLARVYMYSKTDSALLYGREALSLSKKLDFKKGEVLSLISIANAFNVTGNYPKALEHFLQALKIAEEMKDEGLEATVLSSLADVYFFSGDIPRSISYSYKTMEVQRRLGRISNLYLTMLNLGDTYEKIGRLDSALFLTRAAYNYSIETKSYDYYGTVLANLGNIYSQTGKPDSAMIFYRLGNVYLQNETLDAGITESYIGMAKLFLKSKQTDSALYYANLAFSIAKNGGFMNEIMETSKFLANYYKSVRNVDSAYAYQSATIEAKDSLFSQQKANEIQGMNYEEGMRQQQIEEEKEKAREQLKQNALLGGLATVLIVTLLLLFNNRQKQKANRLLLKQKQEIDAKALELAEQKETLQQSYSNVELMGEIGRKITSSLTIEKIIGTVYNNVNTLMDAAAFGIGIYNHGFKRIEFPATYENGQVLPFYTNSIYDENRLAPICFVQGKEIIIGDLETEYQNYIHEVADPHEGEQPVSLIFLPLIARERKLGVITVQSFSKNAYSDYHVNMLRNIAIYTAIALENAESYEKLNNTVKSLQETQKQLVQSEKMASLGELTAGIAHEIQNPLNFINNFSELNNELIEELKRADLNTEEREKILADIFNNNEKITVHGRRADGIVKGMLQHSRNNSGQKELTNINTLCDEYSRLAYHGLRAKDKSFNANIKTSFDEKIGKISIARQDIGRVLLNLLANAFYAVKEKNSVVKTSGKSDYEPTVTVKSQANGDRICISVSDNGNGIPEKYINKIFQPFFTTKPTGEGTGLGLSLSYDIVKEGHGGDLKVETKAGEGTTFYIYLPQNHN